jgi:hypothetical protein
MENKEVGYIDYLLGGKRTLNEAEGDDYKSPNEFMVAHKEKPKSGAAQDIGMVRINPYPGHDLEIAVHNKIKNEYARVLIPAESVPAFIEFATAQFSKKEYQ